MKIQNQITTLEILSKIISKGNVKDISSKEISPYEHLITFRRPSILPKVELSYSVFVYKVDSKGQIETSVRISLMRLDDNNRLDIEHPKGFAGHSHNVFRAYETAGVHYQKRSS